MALESDSAPGYVLPKQELQHSIGLDPGVHVDGVGPGCRDPDAVGPGFSLAARAPIDDGIGIEQAHV